MLCSSKHIEFAVVKLNYLRVSFNVALGEDRLMFSVTMTLCRSPPGCVLDTASEAVVATFTMKWQQQQQPRISDLIKRNGISMHAWNIISRLSGELC